MAKRPRENSVSDQYSAFTKQGEGNNAHTPKIVQMDMPDENPVKLQCSLPPHKTLVFTSYPDYETHYNKSHTNRCSECGKSFPSAHFLGLHQSENHDPIMSVKRDQGEKTLSCFVEDCDKICKDWQKRRNHLVDKHGFPKNYDFFIVATGIDGRRSMLRGGVDAQGHRKSSRERRGSSATVNTQTTEATSVSQHSDDIGGEVKVAPRLEVSAGEEDASLEMVTKSMSSLQIVPRSVTFGKRKGKSGFAKS